MWAGNVPRDARHDELWSVFAERASSDAHAHGVLSIFFIPHSACALVNYSSAATLAAAIAKFDGVPFRAGNAGSALKCRPRDGDDDLHAGVGGQRGVGMHEYSMRDRTREWVEAESGAHFNSERHTDKDRAASTRAASTMKAAGSASSGSASTSSSMLARHFPQRFFILKSLTREDLDLSVRTGVWATQHHNEGVLDRAFRTAADVVLIFSVNKSGEFYGWARCVCAVFSFLSPAPHARMLTSIRRMEGPVGQGKAAVWHAPGDQAAGPAPTAEAEAETHAHSPFGNLARAVQSAPALFACQSSALLTVLPVLKSKYSLDPIVLRVLEHPLLEPLLLAAPRGTEEGIRAPADTPNRAGNGGGRQEQGGEGEGMGQCWGQNFALHWMCTTSLPFKSTRSLRNPWNHDRQVKVARDGTELEPAVGRALIEQWSGSGADGTLQGLKLG
ncbi:YT521-B-like domain-containing protein [Mycena pura]|uniref:YT521-B-like domain-containing protein n=1 Tax=Mycena pura TaxID=153505 RepID=A0AAD6YDN3_9AGAR|nr:YT521-B-like domain-containing protein [Mycena pura]